MTSGTPNYALRAREAFNSAAIHGTLLLASGYAAAANGVNFSYTLNDGPEKTFNMAVPLSLYFAYKMIVRLGQGYMNTRAASPKQMRNLLNALDDEPVTSAPTPKPKQG